MDSPPPPALAGGTAAKVSLTYEDIWTQNVLLDLVEGTASQMEAEPIGPAGIGIEFWVSDPSGIKTYHQVKYQSGHRGWTLASLTPALKKLGSRLAASSSDRCQFVSAQAPVPVDVLRSDAHKARDAKHLVDTILSGERQEHFADLQKIWGIGPEDCRLWLSERFGVVVIDWRSLERQVHIRSRLNLEGDPEHVTAALHKFAIERLGQVFDADQLTNFLVGRGHPVRPWVVADQIEQLQATTVHALDRRAAFLTGQTFQPRREVTQVVEGIERARFGRAVLLTGPKGQGKSAVLAEVTRALMARGTPVAFVDVASSVSATSADDIGSDMGLTTSPVDALAIASRRRPAVLVLDAVDTVGRNRTGDPRLYRIVHDLIREAQAHPRIGLVMSCRSEDLDTDDRLRGLASETDSHRVDLGLLSDTDVASIRDRAGALDAELSPEQLTVLRLPFNLDTFIRTYAVGSHDWASSEDLLNRYDRMSATAAQT